MLGKRQGSLGKKRVKRDLCAWETYLDKRLYESRIIITRISDRKPSHKIDCMGMLEYIVW
ncbi:hypothetical protein HanXRQr2_Chr02g0076291 [Helianthus annuus]|uniref:Uncharacterized protein n=1 Tax=Helianthus annuus TaxID=4232 RepID=A0A9K3P0C2_HELAN|nr:hypothetical protein HanXRQr2_Chr02g0076291 [Helianthus annuus]